MTRTIPPSRGTAWCAPSRRASTFLRTPRRCGVTCASYPCARLRRLDKRYRSKYRMSMIENLEELHKIGVEAFVELERGRWTCPHCGVLVSVHKETCIACGESVEDTRGTGLTRRCT